MPRSHINPIIPGFAPDPSIIRVEDTYFLVNSTFHVFPGIPIYTSKDLISWKQIGNAIHRQSQLSLAGSSTNIWPPNSLGESMLATGGLYAPTIRHQDGVFYIDIYANEWSDPLYFDFQVIDPSLFFDDDGRVYIQGSASPGPMTKIHLFEIELETGKKLSEEKKIWDGTGGIYPEGPHIYKKDGWYYLMISEGGTHENHMITTARAKEVSGPYEAFDGNPILAARGKDEYVRFTGHGDVVQDLEGQWWGVCLGVRMCEGRYVMGTETFLMTGESGEGEWLSLNQVKMDPVLNGKAVVRVGGTPRLTTEPMVDDLYIRDADLSHHTLSDDAKTITLTASKGDLSQWDEPVTFVGKRQREIEGTASVTMRNASAALGAQLKAGFAYYKDEHRYMRILYGFSTSAITFEVINNAKKISRTTSHGLGMKDLVHLCIEYTKTSLCFSYGVGEGSVARTSFDSVDTLDITGLDFDGPIIGVFATSQEQDSKVQFDDLMVD